MRIRRSTHITKRRDLRSPTNNFEDERVTGMQFSWLEGVSKKWKEILVIGRTIERDGKRYHIVGMTLSLIHI